MWTVNTPAWLELGSEMINIECIARIREVDDYKYSTVIELTTGKEVSLITSYKDVIALIKKA